jgi:hypothetical protein
MSSDFKRVINIGKTEAPTYEKLMRPGQRDRLFERDWDELVIRFDRLSQRFVIKTAGGREDSRSMTASEGKK